MAPSQPARPILSTGAVAPMGLPRFGFAERRPTSEFRRARFGRARLCRAAVPTRRVDCRLARIFSAGNPSGTD